MAQKNWRFNSHRGHSYVIGLYHSEQSGNVVIYCNSNVTTIDFGVLDTKEYSFFVGEELLVIKIKKTGTQYSYEMVIDKKVNTPLNAKRMENQKEENRGLLFVLLSFIAAFLLLFLYLYLF